MVCGYNNTISRVEEVFGFFSELIIVDSFGLYPDVQIGDRFKFGKKSVFTSIEA